jgi:hypothetical protein
MTIHKAGLSGRPGASCIWAGLCPKTLQPVQLIPIPQVFFAAKVSILNTMEDAPLTKRPKPFLSPIDDFVFKSLFDDPNHLEAIVIVFLKTFLDLPDEDYAEIAVARRQGRKNMRP